jgi:hypothetical protein
VSLFLWCWTSTLALPSNLLKWGCTIPNGEEWIAMCAFPRRRRRRRRRRRLHHRRPITTPPPRPPQRSFRALGSSLRAA